LDKTGINFLQKNNIPVATLERDSFYLEKRDINVVTKLKFWEENSFANYKIIAIPAKHGHSWMHNFMANGAGFYLQLPDEPSIYISGDTVLTNDVKKALKELNPDITVVAAGNASLDVGGDILMPLSEILEFIKLSPNKVIANHLEALNHCPITREQLKNELIIIDGQFFAPYALELKEFTDGLGKPVTRFYLSHDHPDHYIGFGDAFPNVPVFALAETKAAIEQAGQGVLEQRQAQFGPMIASKLNKPSVVQQPGEETIGNVKFIFEKSVNNESAVSLVIKLPELGVYIAQDIVYNKVHLFIEGDTKGWETALHQIIKENNYQTIIGTQDQKYSILENHTKKVELNLKKEKIKNKFTSGLAGIAILTLTLLLITN
jgi:L-ascorbate metabolism protein UlaG (beta-lactamase superfamily)